MNIQIKKVKENEDGSADAEVFLDEEAKDFLIRKAIIDALTEAAAHGRDFNTPKDEQ